MDNTVMRYESQIKISPASKGKINEQFALVDIMLCYEGKNRNHTIISKESIENALYSLYGCPIIGERVIKDNGEEDFGTHGGKIVVDSNGVRFEQTTKAFGFITKEAVDNAKWVTVTEKDGHTNHNYLQLKGCFVWNQRFEEVSELLDNDYPQSMELSIKESEYNSENYLVIKEFVFTAACILGSDVEPCFESASIGRHYEIDSVKQDLDIMMSEYDTYQKNNNPTKKEENTTMDYAKIVEKLSAFTYENVLGETVSKYSLVDSGENSICILDREDYKTYSVDCALVDEDVVIDMDNKVECSLTSKEISEDKNFSIADEVNIATEVMKQTVSVTISQSYAEEYNKKIDELTEAYAKLKSDYDAMAVEYNKYKTADEARLEKEHHAQIDAVVEKYAKKIGRLPKFLCYRAKIDYTKDVADIENELILMAGEAMMDTSKQNFSYTPSVCPVSGTPADKLTHNDRYGNLFDKFITD